MSLTRRLLAAVLATCALVPLSASASTSEDGRPTWDQVRAALPQRPAAAGAPGGNVAVSIPDLAAAVDDPSAPAAVRRAACHQVTGQDDETAAPLAACLAHVRGDGP